MNDNLQALLDIESIKRLKARYFRALDNKDWEAFSSCFTQDLVAEFRFIQAQSRDAFVSEVADKLRDGSTIHHGHMPEIELVDDKHANGIWSMEDIVKLPQLLIHGWGHYHEAYRKEQGMWKIARVKLTRLRLLHNGEEQEV